MPSQVLIDATPLDTEHRFRGIGSYVRGLLKGLKGIDYEFHTLRQSRRWGKYGKVTAISQGVFTNVRPVRPRLRLDWMWNELLLRREVESLSVGLYHATDPAGIPLSARFGTVATVYDLIPLVFPEYLQKSPRDQRIGYRRSLRKLDEVAHAIAISEFTKQDLVSRLGMDPNKITAIPLGVDLGNFSDLTDGGVESVRERYNLPERYVLYVGSLEAHKRVPLAVEAAVQAKTPLVIAGRHSDGQRQQLGETVRRLRAGSHVRYLGYVSGEDLPVLYENARAFVFPSVYEGFGLPVLEAMAAGCPVITTSAASLPEAAGDGALVLRPDSLAALVEAISEIAENDSLREKLVAAGVARAKRFSWENTARKTIEVYERVLEERV